jgi:hypothetical protein
MLACADVCGLLLTYAAAASAPTLAHARGPATTRHQQGGVKHQDSLQIRGKGGDRERGECGGDVTLCEGGGGKRLSSLRKPPPDKRAELRRGAPRGGRGGGCHALLGGGGTRVCDGGSSGASSSSSSWCVTSVCGLKMLVYAALSC